MNRPRVSLHGMPAIERVRMASETSVVVRTVLISALAIAVTIGGVFAGAFLAAPLAAKASSPATMALLRAKAATLASNVGNVAGAASGLAQSLPQSVARAAESATTTLPPQAARLALPTTGVVALLVLGIAVAMVRRRRPDRSLGHSANSAMAPAATTLARLTPRTNPKMAAVNQKTPRAVEALAASGASASDIAWRTRLPIDAVQLLLSLSNATRQFHPPTA